MILLRLFAKLHRFRSKMVTARQFSLRFATSQVHRQAKFRASRAMNAYLWRPLCMLYRRYILLSIRSQRVDEIKITLFSENVPFRLSLTRPRRSEFLDLRLLRLLRRTPTALEQVSTSLRIALRVPRLFGRAKIKRNAEPHHARTGACCGSVRRHVCAARAHAQIHADFLPNLCRILLQKFGICRTLPNLNFG